MAKLFVFVLVVRLSCLESVPFASLCRHVIIDTTVHSESLSFLNRNVTSFNFIRRFSAAWDRPSAVEILRIRGGKGKGKKRDATQDNQGQVTEGIASFVQHLRSGQLQLGSDVSQVLNISKNADAPSGIDTWRTEPFSRYSNTSRLSSVAMNRVVATPAAADSDASRHEPDFAGVGSSSLYERMGLRSSALDDTIGQRLANESLNQVEQAESADEEVSSDKAVDLQSNTSICDRIGVLPNDDMETIERKFLQYLIGRGDQIAAEIGVSDWIDDTDRALLLAEGPADDGIEAGGANGRRKQWVDLNAEVPPEEEQAFVKAVCRQILFVRNLPKQITGVRAPRTPLPSPWPTASRPTFTAPGTCAPAAACVWAAAHESRVRGDGRARG
jgi:hypothetical protein